MLKDNAEYDLRKLIHTKLETPAITYNGGSVLVFESVPKDQQTPYIVLGDCAYEPEDSKEQYFDRYGLELAVITFYGGTTDAVSIKRMAMRRLSEGWRDCSLQFGAGVNFQIRGFEYGAGATRGIRKEQLEESTQELFFFIEQTG